MSCLYEFALCLLIVNIVVSEVNPDGGKAPGKRLNDGNSIPIIGLGTFLGFDEKGQKQSETDEVEAAVVDAVNAGYRLIDTAQLYNVEEQVGSGVQKSGVGRENVFIVTKVSPANQRNAVEALQESLKKMNTSYVDLYLIHTPISFKEDHKTYDNVDYLDTWKLMETTKKMGLAKSIGISNFNISQIERLMENCEIAPSVLQVEVNLNLAQNKLIDFCESKNITVMAYTPFGSLFNKLAAKNLTKLDDPILVEIAKTYKKTVPQIILRYLVQRGLVPIPKSVHKNRIEQNIDIFDITLTPEEMDKLSQFNSDVRTVGMSFWQDHPYFPFEHQDVPGKNPFDAKSSE